MAVSLRLDGVAADSSPQSSLPYISVVIPTYNRASILPYLFDALGKQVYPAARMEAIVVDNSSSDDTEAVVMRWRQALPFPLTFHRKENRGPAASRNVGAMLARGDIIGFTDSDCIPSPGWLRAAARAFAGGAGLVCGPILPRLREGQPGLMASQLPAATHDDGLYPTANLLVRKQALEAAGGFNEHLGLNPWGDLVAGEDADLAWRVKRTGVQAVFDEHVVVGHMATRIRARVLLLRPFRVQVMPWLVRTIPELRWTYLWKHYFMSSSRVYYYVALAGLAAAALTRQWALIVTTLPWLVFHGAGTTVSLVRRGEVAKAIAWLCLVAWFDTVTTCALVLGSVRNRRLVL
jgi:glycosyltransferase involved in cell wall biosynthesis